LEKYIYLDHKLIKKKKVAIKKTIHSTPKQKRKNFQEIRFLRYCRNHPNIVQFIRASLYSGEMWIITENILGATLTQLVNLHKFSENEIVYIAKNILHALDFLHDNQLAHRDLKSGNIMIDIYGNVKLIDFGLCSDISQGEVVHMVGSPFWMPPEMIQKQSHGLPVDIWSFGICLIEIANSQPPNSKSSIYAMLVAATIGYPEPLLEKEKWSPDFLDFISGCLIINPKDRWTVKQLLQHKFISNESINSQTIGDLIKFLFQINEST